MARVRITRSITRKDGKARATISSAVKVATSPKKSSVSISKKIIPNNVK